MTLRIFDITNDAYRDVTQVDIDCLQAVQNAYGRLRATLAQDHAVLLAEIKRIRSAAGQPNESDGWVVVENAEAGVDG